MMAASEVAHREGRGGARRLYAGGGVNALGQAACRAGIVIVCSDSPSPQA